VVVGLDLPGAGLVINLVLTIITMLHWSCLRSYYLWFILYIVISRLSAIASNGTSPPKSFSAKRLTTSIADVCSSSPELPRESSNIFLHVRFCTTVPNQSFAQLCLLPDPNSSGSAVFVTDRTSAPGFLFTRVGVEVYILNQSSIVMSSVHARVVSFDFCLSDNSGMFHVLFKVL
jgi:hypothetical protein